MDPQEIVTLIFPNYSIKPVRQHWRIKTLCLLPYFNSLFAQDNDIKWSDADKREFIMEEDPEIFSRLMRTVITSNKEEELKRIADFYGVDINPAPPKKNDIVEYQEAINIPIGETSAYITTRPCTKIERVIINRPADGIRMRNINLFVGGKKLPVNPFSIINSSSTISLAINGNITDENKGVVELLFQINEVQEYDIEFLISIRATA